MAAVAAIYPLFVALAASGAAKPEEEEGEEEGFEVSTRATASSYFSLLSLVFLPALLVTDLVVSKATPFGWRIAGRVGRVLRLGSGGGGGGGARGRGGRRR